MKGETKSRSQGGQKPQKKLKKVLTNKKIHDIINIESEGRKMMRFSIQAPFGA